MCKLHTSVKIYNEHLSDTKSTFHFNAYLRDIAVWLLEQNSKKKWNKLYRIFLVKKTVNHGSHSRIFGLQNAK